MLLRFTLGGQCGARTATAAAVRCLGMATTHSSLHQHNISLYRSRMTMAPTTATTSSLYSRLFSTDGTDIDHHDVGVPRFDASFIDEVMDEWRPEDLMTPPPEAVDGAGLARAEKMLAAMERDSLLRQNESAWGWTAVDRAQMQGSLDSGDGGATESLKDRPRTFLEKQHAQQRERAGQKVTAVMQRMFLSSQAAGHVGVDTEATGAATAQDDGIIAGDLDQAHFPPIYFYPIIDVIRQQHAPKRRVLRSPTRIYLRQCGFRLGKVTVNADLTSIAVYWYIHFPTDALSAAVAHATASAAASSSGIVTTAPPPPPPCFTSDISHLVPLECSHFTADTLRRHIQEALEHCLGRARYVIGRQLNQRYVPHLQFRYDNRAASDAHRKWIETVRSRPPSTSVMLDHPHVFDSLPAMADESRWCVWDFSHRGDRMRQSLYHLSIDDSLRDRDGGVAAIRPPVLDTNDLRDGETRRRRRSPTPPQRQTKAPMWIPTEKTAHLTALRRPGDPGSISIPAEVAAARTGIRGGHPLQVQSQRRHRYTLQELSNMRDRQPDLETTTWFRDLWQRATETERRAKLRKRRREGRS